VAGDRTAGPCVRRRPTGSVLRNGRKAREYDALNLNERAHQPFQQAKDEGVAGREPCDICPFFQDVLDPDGRAGASERLGAAKFIEGASHPFHDLPGTREGTTM